MEVSALKLIAEGALLASSQPLSLDKLQSLFQQGGEPDNQQLREALTELQQDYAERAIELVEVASGWRVQVRSRYSQWVSKLWDEKPQKYSRALLETLSLIAYKQPITRGEIEEVRGVAVSSNITRTLLEREWVRIVGHREVPGRPALYATTRQFLDYFNLKSLEELPSLQEVRELSVIQAEIELPLGELPAAGEGDLTAADQSEADSSEAENSAAGSTEKADASQNSATHSTADEADSPDQEVDDDEQQRPTQTLH